MTLGQLRYNLRNLPDDLRVYNWNYDLQTLDDVAAQLLGWPMRQGVEQVLVLSIKSEDPQFVRGAIQAKEDLL